MNDSIFTSRLLSDSITIARLQIKIDSISKITNENLINSKYFDSTISSHLGIFIFLLSLIGIVSIISIKEYLDNKYQKTVNENNQFNEKIKERIAIINTEISNEIIKIDHKQNESEYLICKAMYLSCVSLSLNDGMLYWLLYLLNISTNTKNHIEDINELFRLLENCFLKFTEDKIYISDNTLYCKIIEMLEKLELKTELSFIEKINFYKESIIRNHYLYTPVTSC